MLALKSAAHPFDRIYEALAHMLTLAPSVDVGEVHAQKTESEEWVSHEIQNVIFEYECRHTLGGLQDDVRPNLPWAEDHFQERVSGIPHNPPPSATYWPFKRKEHEEHTDSEGKFSHTYPERMWPVHGEGKFPYPGIRFPFGTLDDLVRLLVKNPYTRQAYLPIWFPEDLNAALYEQRVPCTLGYHFLAREGNLNMTYFIRSCDLVRFFRDDVYMACRLCQWVVEQIHKHHDPIDPGLVPGTLTMHITSLHCFEGDLPNLRKNYARS